MDVRRNRVESSKILLNFSWRKVLDNITGKRPKSRKTSNEFHRLLNESDSDSDTEGKIERFPLAHVQEVELDNKNGVQGNENLKTDHTPKDRISSFKIIIGLVVIGITLIFGILFVTGVLNPSHCSFSCKNDTKHIKTDAWRMTFSDWGTESCIRLVDVDGDGLSDVILGLTRAGHISRMVTESSMKNYCMGLGLKVPCAGALIALRGYDGKLLWNVTTYSEIFAINCDAIDANKDGTTDCVASGRLADIRVINRKNGELIWEGSGQAVFNRAWNIYSIAVLSDIDNDGVNDIVVAHGGDPRFKPHVHKRHPGRLIMLSGATGKPIGRHLEIPENKETYVSPVIHQRRDGSHYILFGSGGETVGGSFLAISVPDLYRYAKQLSRSHPVPGYNGEYNPWGNRRPDNYGVIEIFRSHKKGILVPPVLVDVNKDGVHDIFMSSFDGTMVLFDGETLKIMWTTKVEGRESYSSPAPGYFNEDDVIDFMVHWYKGAWPYYNDTDIIIIDGKNGSILWNMSSDIFEFSSDLVLKTSTRYRDVFLFHVRGRLGDGHSPIEAFHGATGIQRKINNGDITKGINYSCGSDPMGISRVTQETFLIDRTIMSKPLKLFEKRTKKLYYNLRDGIYRVLKDKERTDNENNTLKYRQTTESKVNGSAHLCSMSVPQGTSTGAVGDVDGDGTVDVIIIVMSSALLKDHNNKFVNIKMDTDVYKINLDDAINKGIYTSFYVTSVDGNNHHRLNESRFSDLKLLPPNKHSWGGYMGTVGNSICGIV